jgi:ferritin-like metal-binding protein YciE
MKMQSIQGLMVTGMTSTLDFEQKLGQAAPKMADAASDPELKETFKKPRARRRSTQRLEQSLEKLGQKAHKK